MEEVGSQVAYLIVTQLDFALHIQGQETWSTFVYQNYSDNWNPKSWGWNSANFVSKPLQSNGILLGSCPHVEQDSLVGIEVTNDARNDRLHGENLRLNLGAQTDGILNSAEELRAASRSNKRGRCGSPGGTNYLKCQVDNCNDDLSTAKDYHRRHKVSESHSKASKALVAKHMQGFCQQYSRFHHLPEFDERKRSCRGGLAGHNRMRKRKNLPLQILESLENTRADPGLASRSCWGRDRRPPFFHTREC